MRKLLAAVLLAAAMVAPAFAAEKGSMEIDGKLGLLFSPKLTMEARGESHDVSFDTAFSLGADFFCYVDPKVALGFGLEYAMQSESEKEDGESMKLGSTNLFVQAKYNFDLNDDTINTIYPIAQLGYGILSTGGSAADHFDIDNGLYWGIGAGMVIKQNFLVELLYSFNYGSFDVKGAPISGDITYKAFKLKVGYKFSI